MEMIRDLSRTKGFTVAFIEHDMQIVFNYSDRISVLDHGTLIATDTPENIKVNEFVQSAYFGGGDK
jgi:branched-chain amino acid transport system ATP-binding protein